MSVSHIANYSLLIGKGSLFQASTAMHTVKIVDNRASNILTLDGGVGMARLDYWDVIFVARVLPIHLQDEYTNNNKIWIAACHPATCRLYAGNTCPDYFLVGRLLYAVCHRKECEPEKQPARHPYRR